MNETERLLTAANVRALTDEEKRRLQALLTKIKEVTALH